MRDWPVLSQRVVTLTPLTYGHVGGVRMMPTHFYFDRELDKQIISDFANSRFIYKSISKQNDDWAVSNMPSLRRPHALTYNPDAGKYFAVDTDNHQLISFSSFDSSVNDDVERFSDVNGVALGKRPHDIAFNAADRYVYVVLNNGVLRFRADESGILDSGFISRADITSAVRKNYPATEFSVGYIRSLSIVDGVLYLSNSTQGNIIQIGDFLAPETWTVIFNKNQPKKYSEKGDFDNDGLIINDIEYFNGYWYATNYYAGNVSNYLSNAAVSKNKLIRWRTWDEFANSEWEDLSGLVHPESVTYNFTKTDKVLYLSMFHNGNKGGLGSGVYAIKTSIF